jgi:hypothetical protein
MSVAGGYHNAVAEAQRHGCQTVQLFTKNQMADQGRAFFVAPLLRARQT